jgi:hypothetical protein
MKLPSASPFSDSVRIDFKQRTFLSKILRHLVSEVKTLFSSSLTLKTKKLDPCHCLRPLIMYSSNLVCLLLSEAKVIKLFTLVIYCHSMVRLSFCVIKLGNGHGMAVNCHGKKHWPKVANLNAMAILMLCVKLPRCFYNIGSRPFEPLLGA